MDMVVQGVQTMDRGAVGRRRPEQFGDVGRHPRICYPSPPPVNPFVAKREAALGLQPEADLLRTPTLCPKLAGDGTTDTAYQFARLILNLLPWGLRAVSRVLLKVIPPPSPG